MKTALMCLLLCLLPWTVRAQDTLQNRINDSGWVPVTPWVCDTLYRRNIQVVPNDMYFTDTIFERTWIHTPDSVRIHPEPWPDSALVAYVKHLVDSSLAQLGHWEMRVVPCASLPWDGPNWVIKDTSLMMDCIAWVFVKGPKK